MKFLESLTAFGYEILVPVDRIAHVKVTYGLDGWQIVIKGKDEDEFELIECFQKDEDKLNKRWKEIKAILAVK